MIKRIAPLIAAAALLSAPLPQRADAEVVSQTYRSLRVEGTPLDVALSVDGQTLFVLTKERKVFFLTPDGTLQDTLLLDAPADSLAVTPRGEALILTDSASGEVRILLVERVQEFDTAQAPSRGPADAPVTITLFTDFQ